MTTLITLLIGAALGAVGKWQYDIFQSKKQSTQASVQPATAPEVAASDATPEAQAETTPASA